MEEPCAFFVLFFISELDPKIYRAKLENACFSILILFLIYASAKGAPPVQASDTSFAQTSESSLL